MLEPAHSAEAPEGQVMVGGAPVTTMQKLPDALLPDLSVAATRHQEQRHKKFENSRGSTAGKVRGSDTHVPVHVMVVVPMGKTRVSLTGVELPSARAQVRLARAQSSVAVTA